MITKQDIVNRAFKLLSMSGFELDDSPEDEQDILETLDDMMAEMQGEDYNFGYILPTDDVPSNLSDNSGIYKDALSGIAHQLAIRICSVFGKPPPPLLVGQAAKTYNALLTRYMLVPRAPRIADSWNFGSGNKIRGF